MENIDIRKASKEDVPVIYNFIKALAEYEKLSHEMHATEESIEDSLFGETHYAKVLLVYEEDEPVGFALYFYNFSTFLGKPGIYLEDLFVKPENRGKGYGKALLVELAQIAVEENCGRVEWSVLDWNTPSINFYKGIGAELMDEWTICRLTGESIPKLANLKKL